MGFFVSQFFVFDDATESGVDGLGQVQRLMKFTAIVGTVLLSLSFFFLKEKPLTPPRYNSNLKLDLMVNSKAAAKEKFSYKESLKSLAKNRNYLTFVFGAGFVWGTYNVLATILNLLLSPFGYTSV